MIVLKTAPFEHQREIFEKTCNMRAFALFLEAGTGKTWIMLATALYLFQKGEIDALIVLYPNGLSEVHKDELTVHWPIDRIGYHLTHYISGMTDKQLAALTSGAAPRSGSLSIVLMNIEAISTPRGLKWLSHVMKGYRGRVLLTIDESHTVKNPSAKRTKAVLSLRQLSKYKRIMSGTPMGGGYEDLYSQFKILEPDIIGMKTFTEFCSQYVIEQMTQRYRAIIGYRNVKELMEKIDPYSRSVTKDDCLDLPGETMQTIHVPLSPEQRAAYRDLVSQYKAELEGGQMIEAVQVTKRLIRLQQITSGWFVSDDGEVTTLPCPKIDMMLELVRTARHQVVIWCRFQRDVRRVAEALEEAHVKTSLYYGGATDEECAEAYQRFGRGESFAFIATPDKGGMGLNKLVGASTIIRYSHTNRFILYSQSMDRTKRIGQAHKNAYYDLVTPKSIEEKIIHTVRVERADLTDALRTATAWRNWLDAEI